MLLKSYIELEEAMKAKEARLILEKEKNARLNKAYSDSFALIRSMAEECEKFMHDVMVLNGEEHF